jgi:hypothetical protein
VEFVLESRQSREGQSRGTMSCDPAEKEVATTRQPMGPRRSLWRSSSCAGVRYGKEGAVISTSAWAFEASLITTHPFVPSDVRTSSDDQERGDDACSPEATVPPPVSSRIFLLSALSPGGLQLTNQSIYAYITHHRRARSRLAGLSVRVDAWSAWLPARYYESGWCD